MKSEPLNLAFVVHGRFHMFDLAREIAAKGHNVSVFTNYPAFIAKRFGVPANRVYTNWFHGLSLRFLGLPGLSWLTGKWEGLFHRQFGAWAKKALVARQPQGGWDAILSMSGIAEEPFAHFRNTPTLCVLHRGSTHIRDQWEILDQEEKRTGKKVEKPSPWIIEREEKEYQLADLIRIQSPFAYGGFQKFGLPDSKLDIIPLGVSRSKFQMTSQQTEARRRRIANGEPLRILGTGTFCLRKGAWDLRTLVNRLPKDRFSFRFVGKIAEDAIEVADSLKGRVEFIAKVPQDQLPEQYAWGDLFILPSLEDGFAVVVTQALSCGLPTIVSQNTGSSLFVKDDINGWVVPIRSPETMEKILLELDQDRPKLIKILETMNQTNPPGSWEETAQMTMEDIKERSEIKKSMNSMS